MLGFKPLIRSPISSISRPIFHFTSFPLKTQLKFSKTQSGFILFAQNNSNNNQIQEPSNQEQQQNNGSPKNSGDADNDDDLRGSRNSLFNIKLGDLLLDPDPDNILAVGLTGLLAWASAQVLWQLFVVSFAILVAALKYSFIAALLVFILITLL
ncbi:uncharacterized protein LOC8279085 [Ricinus communis]|uniref:Transmembrane protein n=1 Tax=Ricinus communis TaxID=3988 RepID=B9T3G3_RICCO|nr:uncharacterized protein LOC8279085 [Ricinus communis]EEF29601.1 conserved hypothetical protein [Ricinus communis]|eukprot:XP_015583102.1 uncharacterized protein LOC8279085 [Ricinus communis]